MSLILSHFVLTPALLTHTFDSSHFPPSDLRKHIGYVKENLFLHLLKMVKKTSFKTTAKGVERITTENRDGAHSEYSKDIWGCIASEEVSGWKSTRRIH